MPELNETILEVPEITGVGKSEQVEVNEAEAIPKQNADAMNVLFISHQKEIDVLGLKFIHYTLLDNGFNSHIINIPYSKLNDKDLATIKEFVSNINPKFIGVSLMTEEFLLSSKLTDFLKKHFNVPIIWGGIHPTVAPKMCLEHADYICIGEGEMTILDFAKAIKNKQDPKELKNLVYMDNGEMKMNEIYPLFDGLDSIPIYEHIPKNTFILDKNGKIINMDRKTFNTHSRFRGYQYDIISSRGCPFSCTFCCNNFFHKTYGFNKVRKRSVPHIIAELEQAVTDNPNLKYINFQDDCFVTGRIEYLKEFAKEYKEKIKIPFWIKSMPTYMNEEKAQILKDASVAFIEIGLQSGSDRINREVFERKSYKKDWLKCMDIMHRYKIPVACDVILDTPGETEEDKIETIQTLIETPKPFYTQFFSMDLYYGTKMRETVLKENPDVEDDTLTKDYYDYQKTTLNIMTRMASFLNEKDMNKLLALYKQDKNSSKFKRLFSSMKLKLLFIEPITYFRVIHWSYHGNYYKTIKAIPGYLKKGLRLYLKQFKKHNNVNDHQSKNLQASNSVANGVM